jgi:membrane-associated phospholipid phosphatase
MSRGVHGSGDGMAAAGAVAQPSLARALARYWRVLQNVLIIFAATILPALAGLGSHAAIAAFLITSIALISARSDGGRNAKTTQFILGYVLIWMLFHDIRAVADSTPWVDALQNKAWDIERWLFRGELANARLQRTFFNPDHRSPFDFFITGIYLSFFVVSLIAGIVVSRRDWPRTWRFFLAKSVVFALGFVIILAWPSNPPWLTPDSALQPTADAQHRVYRVTTIVLGQGDDYALGEDQNALAAMPSVHMATTFLVLLLLWGYGLRWRIVGGIYASLMAFALVYLGEHYVIDELAGIALALGSWQIAHVLQWRWLPPLVDRARAIPISSKWQPKPAVTDPVQG